MRQQSNTALYVVAGCIAVVAVIVIAVRSNAPPPTPKDKDQGSPLAGFQFGPAAGSAMLADPSAEAFVPAPPGVASGAPVVNVSPALIDGQPGLVVRYEVDAIDERMQPMAARALLASIRSDAEEAGVRIIVVVAAVRSDGGEEPEEVHKTYFAQTEEGGWATVEPPGSAVPAPLPAASAR